MPQLARGTANASVRSLAAACIVMLLTAPAAAAAVAAFEPGTCNIAFRQLGPVRIQRSALRVPIERSARRAAWRIDATWQSTPPQLNQTLKTRTIGTYFGVGHARQRSLSIDAVPPDTYGWTYRDDADPTTPPCAMVGMADWQKPRVLLKQQRAAVRLLAVSRHTDGNRAGCELGSDDGEVPCPQVTTTVIRLSAPIGKRRLYLETLSD
jgi:hypothetical protein